MLAPLKSALKKTPIGRAWLGFNTRQRARRDIAQWEAHGCPVPPPHAYKVRTVREYADHFGTSILVETGTFMGDMVAAVRDDFARIYTVELDPDLHRGAGARFADDPKIHILQGDSGRVLAEVLPLVREPCLFWLDAHHSGGITARGDVDTPIMAELRQIFDARIPRTVILIDDARDFVGENDYPTIEALRQFVSACRPAFTFEVRHDIIRVHDPSP